MSTRLSELYTRVFSMYVEMSAHIKHTEEQLFSERVSLEDFADDEFVLHKAAELVDELRKKMNALSGKATAATVVRWSVESPDGGPIRGEYTTTTCRSTEVGALPPKSSPEYTALLKQLGATDETIAADTFRLHWPNLVEQIHKRASEGLPPLVGVSKDKTYPVPKCTRRQKKHALAGCTFENFNKENEKT